MYQEVK